MSKINLQTQLQRRLDALQGYMKFGVSLPDGVTAPGTMAALRRWQVPELGIERIGSKASTNANGKTEEVQLLLGKLVELTGDCEHLASTKVRAPTVKPEDRVAILEKEAQEQGLRLEALAIQLHEVSHERDQLKLGQASANKALNDVREELSNVRRQLNQLAAPGSRPSLVLAEKGK